MAEGWTLDASSFAQSLAECPRIWELSLLPLPFSSYRPSLNSSAGSSFSFKSDGWEVADPFLNSFLVISKPVGGCRVHLAMFAAWGGNLMSGRGPEVAGGAECCLFM